MKFSDINIFGKQRTIKQNILLSFIGLSIISIVILGTISVVFMVRVGDTTATESTLALKTQIKQNISNTSQQIAQVINQKLATSESMIDALVQEAKNIMQTNSYQDRVAYYDYWFQYHSNDISGPNTSAVPSDVTFDQNYGIFASYSASSYYMPGSTPSNYETMLQTNTQLNTTIHKLANLDFLFKYIHENAPEFRWLYVTVANINGTGLFVNYPGSVVGGNTQERLTNPWDPRNDAWYADIENGITFSSPYPDPIDGEPLITIGKTFTSNGLNFAVAGDISIKDVKANILKVKVLDSGYAALISNDGTVIAHPEYNPPKGVDAFKTIDQVELNVTSSGSSSALSTNQINLITSQQSGLIDYSRIVTLNSAPEARYLSFVQIDKGGYVVLIIVPVNEAIKAVGPLQTRINDTTTVNTVEILTIIVLTAVLSILVGLLISNQIIKPVSRLTSIASKLSTDNLRRDILGDLDLSIDKELESQEDEVGDLTRAFTHMIQSIKKENSSEDDNKLDKLSFTFDKVE